MRYRPPGLTDQQVQDALGTPWRITYAPVGAGSYHWIATDGERTRFVTVDDLDDKPWLGETREQVLDGLTACLQAASDLRDSGLDFVVAPEVPLCRLTDRYTITIYPYIDGAAGTWGEQLPPASQRRLRDMLTAIHQASFITAVPVSPTGLPGRHTLETALAETGHGPYSGPVRSMLSEHETQIRQSLARYDTLAAHVETLPRVLTHGEPHPGNVIRTSDGRLMLLDWDTLGLAPAERDLLLLGGPGDPRALDFYRLRWPLLGVVVDTSTLLRGQAAPEVLDYLRSALSQLAERAAQEL